MHRTDGPTLNICTYLGVVRLLGIDICSPLHLDILNLVLLTGQRRSVFFRNENKTELR